MPPTPPSSSSSLQYGKATTRTLSSKSRSGHVVVDEKWDAIIMQQQQQKQQQHLYSVAWNAATEYFINISTKLDNNHQQQQPPPIHSTNTTTAAAATATATTTTRSKSMGNLQNLSLEEEEDYTTTTSSSYYSRALFREMLAMMANNNGGFDVTLLPSDAQIVIFSFLPPKDVLSFTCTNRAGRMLLDDGYYDVVDESSSSSSSSSSSFNSTENSTYGLNRDTPLLIWKALFHRDYSWILTDWDVGKDAFLKSMTNYLHHHGGRIQQQQQQPPSCPKSRKLFRHLLSTLLIDTEYDVTTHRLLIDRIMAADASMYNNNPIVSSMKEFYFSFAESWLNYTIAGCNSPRSSSTTDDKKCLIGLHGHVFDITNFVEDHPGSTETLLLQAGRDATVFFESMGHSLGARKLACGMCVVVNGQCIRWDCIPREGGGAVVDVGDRGWHGSSYWGLIKPTHQSLITRRNILGFLIPRRRSAPRFQGGLHRIRERLRLQEEMELHRAARWGEAVIGTNGMFGGIHVYFDPFCGWRWWYTNRDFNVVFVTPPSEDEL